jgi:hypothetical protein
MSLGSLEFSGKELSRSLPAVVIAFLLLAFSSGASFAQGSRDHVYFLRGAFNIFSLGMDEMSDKLQKQGVTTTVANWVSWSSLADEAAAEYKSGRTRVIIIVGHSSGANAIGEMTGKLGALGVPVRLAIGLDPTTPVVVSGHVEHYINYYIANGMGTAVHASKRFSGSMQNVDVEKNTALNHFNIDKNRALQDRVLSQIRAAL